MIFLGGSVLQDDAMSTVEYHRMKISGFECKYQCFFGFLKAVELLDMYWFIGLISVALWLIRAVELLDMSSFICCC